MKTIVIPFLLLAMLSTCKKEADTRRIPDGSKVWLNSNIRYSDLKQQGVTAKGPFTVLSLYAQTQYDMNFYHVIDSNSPGLYWEIPDNDLQLKP